MNIEYPPGAEVRAFLADELPAGSPQIVRGKGTWRQSFSEPGAGSDLDGLRTTARLGDGGWVIDTSTRRRLQRNILAGSALGLPEEARPQRRRLP